MELKLDVFKQIIEAIKWVKKEIKTVKTAAEIRKINDVLQSISTLVVNKTVYLQRLSLAKGDSNALKEALKSALQTAETDTKNLQAAFKTSGLNISQLDLKLDSSIQAFSSMKLQEVTKYQLLLGTGSPIDIAELSGNLNAYRDKWMELGTELETLKTKLKAKLEN